MLTRVLKFETEKLSPESKWLQSAENRLRGWGISWVEEGKWYIWLILTITNLWPMPYSERFVFLVMPIYYLQRITGKSKLHESLFIFTSNITLRIRTSDMISFRFFPRVLKSFYAKWEEVGTQEPHFYSVTFLYVSSKYVCDHYTCWFQRTERSVSRKLCLCCDWTKIRVWEKETCA